MGVRPPQQDDGDDIDTIAFGIAALDEHLDRDEIVFPTTASALVDRLDDPAIPYDAKGNEMSLSAALEETHADEFETRQDLMNALHPVFEARRDRANNSIVGQLRSLLPF
ncbi:hypothetical protein [Natronomonas marina]|jgi:hypothetical protein|uniref:hypothetical protein n=1 Tax=Natronomonas marina TaxID=2961939 RepID=UPI0020C99075|nr:hypothetical protein [Natronomonas marina]